MFYSLSGKPARVTCTTDLKVVRAAPSTYVARCDLLVFYSLSGKPRVTCTTDLKSTFCLRTVGGALWSVWHLRGLA